MSNSKLQLKYYDHFYLDYEKEGIFKRTTNRAFARKCKIIYNYSAKHEAKLSILEIGAGSGLLSYYVSQYFEFNHYYVTDLSTKMLKLAKERIMPLKIKNITFKKVDLYKIKKMDLKFDLII